ncbi:alpha/beta hydrolase family protein [Gordonia sp. w5E2]|uniref:Esterase n=1 Tax=Gordonia jacobaea TaxID=122202 RepID=A0ABR5IEW9_9ACTN|nr:MULTISPECIES: alpha/beta hydrolase family protein [Gordonia]KNA92182.1 esterase [Gordonia jacobaea]SKX81433.1 putative esterase [Mycobacteroides abscessus subsp. abscessus]
MRHTRITTLIAVIAAALGVGIVGAGTADAAVYRRATLSGCGMPATPVDMWTRAGNYKTVIALSGLRVTAAASGWKLSTNVGAMADSGVNVVAPAGGLASFYTDWNARNSLSNMGYRYRWTCRLDTLVAMLDRQGLDVGPRHKYAIMGISMGGNAALIYGAYHHARISHAFSMSGYLNLSAPGMREAIRLTLLDAGLEAGVGAFNSDDMWGPPWSTRWLDNDPFVQAPRLRGLSVRVAAGSAIWGNRDTNISNSLKGTPLEVLAQAQTRAFEFAASRAGLPITTDYPRVGTHSWGYWEEMAWRAKSAGWFRDR